MVKDMSVDASGVAAETREAGEEHKSFNREISVYKGEWVWLGCG